MNIKNGKYKCIRDLSAPLNEIGRYGREICIKDEEYDIRVEYYSDFMCDYISIFRKDIKGHICAICSEQNDIPKVEERFKLFFASLAEIRDEKLQKLLK